jgi:hypothetical protein
MEAYGCGIEQGGNSYAPECHCGLFRGVTVLVCFMLWLGLGFCGVSG